LDALFEKVQFTDGTLIRRGCIQVHTSLSSRVYVGASFAALIFNDMIQASLFVNITLIGQLTSVAYATELVTHFYYTGNSACKAWFKI
jgi:hypothetical protein